MLKQVFDREQLSKTLTSSDVWRWDILSTYGDVEKAVDHTVRYWKSYGLALSPLKRKIVKNKPVFMPSIMEDAFLIKLLDRFIRRIYRVRQSDRNRIVRQLATLLKDSGGHHVLRLDIKDCYESIQSEHLINKFESDLILAPECIKLLESIFNDVWVDHGIRGLPRGLSISPTLAELYLETLDKKISSNPNVIYSARYVDDVIVLIPAGKENEVMADIKCIVSDMGLSLNYENKKHYSGPSKYAEFDYLGYAIKVQPKKENPNQVTLGISKSKLNNIKYRIAIAFYEHKKQNDIHLLKRRLQYLCMLKTVRKGKNGDLLAGLSHNYRYVTDSFECLKPLDGFLCQQLDNPRFELNQQEKEILKKVSIYGNVRKGSVGKFTKKKTAQIMRIWKNA